MSTESKPPTGSTDKPFGEISIKRVAEFFQNVLSLERSVRNLREENKDLRQRVDTLQRLVDDHGGQLKVILSTLSSTMDDRIEMAAQRAALETVVRFLETDDDKRSLSKD